MGIRAVRAQAILNQQLSAKPHPTQQLSVDILPIPRSAEPGPAEPNQIASPCDYERNKLLL